MLFYGAALVLLGIFHNLMWWHVGYWARLTEAELTEEKRRAFTLTWIVGPVLYGACLGLAFITSNFPGRICPSRNPLLAAHVSGSDAGTAGAKQQARRRASLELSALTPTGACPGHRFRCSAVRLAVGEALWVSWSTWIVQCLQTDSREESDIRHWVGQGCCETISGAWHSQVRDGAYGFATYSFILVL